MFFASPVRFLAPWQSLATLPGPPLTVAQCGAQVLCVTFEVFVARSASPRSRRSELIPLVLCGLLCVLACGAWLSRSHAATPDRGDVKPAAPAEPPSPQPTSIEFAPLTSADLHQMAPGSDGFETLTGPQGQKWHTTIDAAAQAAIQADLDRQHVAYAAVVMMEPTTGKILAIVEHREPGDVVGEIGSLTEATVPAASVFKVVTAAALLDAGHTPDLRACYHGGLHGLDASHVHESPRDTQCQTLTEALAHSTNAAFARFALRDLPPGALVTMAERLGFNHPQPADLQLGASPMVDGVTEFERAKTAPGFMGSKLSPLHGALLAASIANNGQAMRPYLVDGDAALPGVAREPTSLGQWLPAEQALALRRMMRETVVQGTGRHAFGVRPKALRGVEIGGKTGSLNGDDPAVFRHISWFVGMAPVEQPRVAIAVVAVNGMQWKAKAPALARDALATWFAAHPAD